MRRRYPSYCDSGVDWIGEMPVRWDAPSVRQVCRLEYGDSLPLEMRESGRVPVYGSNGAVGDHNEANTSAPAIIVGRKGSHGKVNYVDGHAFAIDTTYFVDERSTASNLRWLFYVLSSAGLDETSKDSAVPGLSRSDVYAMHLPCPSLSEQADIAEYLDRETARIDALISKQELLIERLDEYRTALITQTVARGLPSEAAAAAGLDPAPSLKDSGVEWLGEVPEHWQVAQLCRTVLFQRGHDLPVDDREPGVVPVVSSAGITGRHAEAAAGGPAIVTGRYGSIGDFYVVEGSFWPLNTTLYSIDLFGNDVMYVFFLLMSLKPLFLANAEKSAVPGVDRNDIHDILVATPSRREQSAIAEYLDSQSMRIDALRAKAEVSIERLGEYRSALVSAAVTGKIDVREAAAAGAGGGV